ncbi:MAG: HAMP domain-containing sensor histidine kinase [Bacteroidota bacterium]
MNIRSKLVYQFSLIVTTILILFSLAIFYFSATYRQNDFKKRLKERALTTAKLLIGVETIDKELIKIIDNNTFSLYNEHISIFKNKNQCIYQNFENSALEVNSDILNEIQFKKEIFKAENRKETLGFVYYDKKDCYLIIISAFDEFGYGKLKNLQIVLLIGFLVSIAFTIFGGFIYAGRALSPISKVVRQVEKISASNLNSRVDAGNGKDELAKLSITFNEMLTRLETAFDLQKNFVSNASHELRTPFTMILGEIELTLMKDRQKEDYVSVLKTIQQDMKTLSKLSDDLFSLAQVSFDISNFKFVKIRLDELLLQSREDVLKRRISNSIKVNFIGVKDNEEISSIFGNEQLIKSAFINIISNACKFSNGNEVIIEMESTKRDIIIKFIDKGIGIPENELQNIYEPFYRAKNVKNISGYGLGLPLTKKIIDIHKGKISIESEEAIGSTFIITFPNTNKRKSTYK